jgi:glutathione S-transferase
VRLTLAKQPFLSGAKPAYADYILFGNFMWARGVSPLKLLAEDDPVHAWRERMLDLFDGQARKAKGYPV